MYTLKIVLSAAVLVASVFMYTRFARPKLIPRRVLFSDSQRASPHISYDGRMLAYLAANDGVMNVWVRAIGKEDDRQVTFEKERSVRMYLWSPDNAQILYMQDKDGDENWHIYGVDLGTLKLRDFTPFPNVYASVLEVNPEIVGEILISMNKEDPKLFDVYRLNLASGELSLITKNPGHVDNWIVDHELKVRAAVQARDDGGKDLLWREHETDAWKTLLSWTLDEQWASHVVDFSRDGSALYLLDSRFANTNQLAKLDVKTGDYRVLAHDEDYDISGVLMSPKERTIQGYYVLGKRSEFVSLEDAVRADIEVLKKLDTGDMGVASRDYDDRQWVVAFNKDNGPIPFYLYDRQTKKATFLFVNKPQLEGYKLAPMEPISLTSRDGLKLEGYITYPLGVKRSQLPMVLMVHGGPWVRDSWGYNPQAQWLANRGYVCLQINYRVSTGYGKKFMTVAQKEWGGRMLDDLVDATQWAIKEGIADPKRIVIYGGSYGGYAALCGATMTDLFAGAIDVVGPSNLNTFLTSVPPYWSTAKAMFNKMVGNPETEAEFLKSCSPLFYTDKIKIPLMIVQGANDPRVKQAEAEQIVAALKEKNIPHEYMLFADEGHGLSKEKNRFIFYARAEKFLADILKGRYESE